MRKAKKMVWILDGVLFVVVILLGGTYLIRNSMGLLKNNDNLHQNQKSISVSENEVETTNMPESKKTSVTIVLGGDVALKESHETIYDNEGAAGLMSSEVRTILKKADIAMVNQEFPYTDVKPENSEKRSVDPKYVSFFNDIGIDIVSLANDHVLDCEKDALAENCSTLENASIKYAGAGVDMERAAEVQYFEANGYKIAIVAASKIASEEGYTSSDEEPGVFTTYDMSKVNDQIKEAKEYADYVILYIHWGVEKMSQPESDQRNMAKAFVDAGADVVVGSHTHCLQGIEYYEGKPILYGLGDLVLDKTLKRTALASITIGKKKKMEVKLYPCFINNEKTDRITKKSSLKSFFNYMESISSGVSIDEDGVVSSKKE